jgi:predicted dinucleotide-binding enzyme
LKVAFIGCGSVGGALADRLQRLGHEVTLAAHDPSSASVRKALGRNPDLAVAAPAAALDRAELVMLATPYQANGDALAPHVERLAGKVLVDCTNPVGPGLAHALGGERSGTEVIQALLPATRVVKAFSIYGWENFADSAFPGYGVRPAMFFCGDDAAAKRTVAGLLEELGWEPLDVGGAAQALHLEHMALLWVRMVRVGGHAPALVWARLTR